MKKLPENLCKLLILYKIKKGYGWRKKLANKLGVSVSTIGTWIERGDVPDWIRADYLSNTAQNAPDASSTQIEGHVMQDGIKTPAPAKTLLNASGPQNERELRLDAQAEARTWEKAHAQLADKIGQSCEKMAAYLESLAGDGGKKEPPAAAAVPAGRPAGKG